MLFLSLFTDIIVPIFLMIGVGFALDKLFEMDIRTLSRIGFYILAPAIIFNLAFTTTLTTRELLEIGGLFTLVMTLVGVFALALFSLKPFREHRTALVTNAAFSNCGNYGIPLMLLTFGEQGVTINAVNFLLLTITIYTVGLFLISKGNASIATALKNLLKAPVLYAVIIALAMRLLGIGLPRQIALPAKLLADAFVPMALLTLGVQLARVRPSKDLWIGGVLAVVRLFGGPLAAYAVSLAFGLEGWLAAILIVAAAVPSAVNNYIISMEYDRDPELVAQLIFMTTVLSAFTIPIVIWFTRVAL